MVFFLPYKERDCIFSRQQTFTERIQEVHKELHVLELCVGIEERKRVKSQERLQFYKELFEHMRYTGENYYNYVHVKQEYMKSRRRYERIENRVSSICQHINALIKNLEEMPCTLDDEG